MFLSSCAGDKIYSQMTDDQSSTPSEKVEASTYNKLLAPTNISFDSETLTLKWDSVLGAASYDVNVNGKIVKSKITANKLELSEKVIDKDKESQFLISVRAANKDETIKSNYTSFLYDVSNATSSSNFTFTLSEDKGSYSVNGLSPLVVSSFNEELVINREFNGLPVTSIADNAFKGQKKFDKVILPDTITHIGNGAFQNSYIKEIVFSNNLEVIGDYAFEGCSPLSCVTLPKCLNKIGRNPFRRLKIMIKNQSPCFEVYEGNLYDSGRKRLIAFCSGTSDFVIPDSVTTIGGSAFCDCNSLASVVIPDSVTAIGAEAFRGCSSLSSVVIPDSVTTIGDRAFGGCSSLSSVVIPASVTAIGRSAFWGCDSLSSVVIPDSVTTIGEEAFWGCDSLSSVVIPDSVTAIDRRAFEYCHSLSSIQIKAGSISEFERVKNMLIESDSYLGGVEFVKIDK